MLQCLSLLLTLAVMVLALRLMTGPIDLDEFGKKVGRVLMLGVAILVATCLGHFLFTNVLLPDLHGMSQFIARLAMCRLPYSAHPRGDCVCYRFHQTARYESR